MTPDPTSDRLGTCENFKYEHSLRRGDRAFADHVVCVNWTPLPEEPTPSEGIDVAIDVLNRIHRSDPSVLPAIIDHRVPCNEALADDPTVQVGKHGGGWEVGLLGIVNGLFGVMSPGGGGHIAAHYDDSHNLTHFLRLYPRDPDA